MAVGRDGVSAFESIADTYAANRPGYPPILFEEIEALTARPLLGAELIDVGAGTGLATGLLLKRGARVIAAEPGAAMATQLRHALPKVPLVRAVGEALPLRAASADMITYAQSWHWTDPARSVHEAVRVLRPGGALVLFWNVADPDVRWVVEQERRLLRYAPIPAFPGVHPGHLPQGVTVAEVLRRCHPSALPVTRHVHWKRSVLLDAHLSHLASRSNIAALPPDIRNRLIAEERTALLDLFPDGVIDEAYAVQLVVVCA
ncbi:class I SAM-dependent methyltransferase [Mycobacterium simulans]|nr:class I SAM-dependent methyltransferase [Mycobacterium simulans]